METTTFYAMCWAVGVVAAFIMGVIVGFDFAMKIAQRCQEVFGGNRE